MRSEGQTESRDIMTDYEAERMTDSFAGHQDRRRRTYGRTLVRGEEYNKLLKWCHKD